jgi:hypothetical protein
VCESLSKGSPIHSPDSEIKQDAADEKPDEKTFDLIPSRAQDKSGK